MGFWRDAVTVGRLLLSGLKRPKLEVLNAGGMHRLSAETALEAARAGNWTQLANSSFDAPTTELEARAFWLNLYNALTLHALHAAGIKQTVLERAGFFAAFAYRVSGLNFSLGDIEHGVLRGNRAALLSRAPFASGDPRASLVLPLDARIHFALNCGALSCPPIRAYEAGHLEAQLELAAQSYFSSAKLEGQTVWLPRLLDYYRSDFGDPLEFARRYRADLPEKARVRFDPYDWSLGDQSLGDRGLGDWALSASTLEDR
jgi:hypothetical protein